MICMLLIQSCATFLLSDNIKITKKTFEPTDPNAIELFFSKLPDRAYEEIALVKLNNGYRVADLDDLRNVSAKIGANAVIQIRSNPFINGIAVRWK